MGQRLDLHAILLEITPKVYFQPPTNIKMEYPCLVYQRDAADVKFAGNLPYSNTWRYQVTLIDPNPDSPILEQIKALPMCVFQRHFVVNRLNHDVFVLYF